MDKSKVWRIGGGVLMVLVGGVGGHAIGAKFGHPNVGAAVGVTVAIGANFTLMQAEAGTAQPDPAP